jgi:hypothetical protein
MKYDCCWFDGEIDGEPGSDRINMHREFSSRRSIVLSELPEFFRECKCVASIHSVYEWLEQRMCTEMSFWEFRISGKRRFLPSRFCIFSAALISCFGPRSANEVLRKTQQNKQTFPKTKVDLVNEIVTPSRLH